MIASERERLIKDTQQLREATFKVSDCLLKSQAATAGKMRISVEDKKKLLDEVKAAGWKCRDLGLAIASRLSNETSL